MKTKYFSALLHAENCGRNITPLSPCLSSTHQPHLTAADNNFCKGHCFTCVFFLLTFSFLLCHFCLLCISALFLPLSRCISVPWLQLWTQAVMVNVFVLPALPALHHSPWISIFLFLSTSKLHLGYYRDMFIECLLPHFLAPPFHFVAFFLSSVLVLTLFLRSWVMMVSCLFSLSASFVTQWHSTQKKWELSVRHRLSTE